MRQLIVVSVLLPIVASCAAAPQVDLTAELQAIRARSAGVVAAEVAWQQREVPLYRWHPEQGGVEFISGTARPEWSYWPDAATTAAR